MSKHDTICWKCKKATGGCSWSRAFKPVNGWIALPTEVMVGHDKGAQSIPSFDVYACPEFDLLDRLKEEQNGIQR